MPGPPRTPKVLNDLKGDPHKRRRHEVEPTPPPERPTPPDDLDKAARQEWDFLCDQLARMGLLSSADRDSLILYVEAWSRYHAVKKAPLVQRYENGVVQVSAAYTILTKERKMMCDLLQQFGMTPAARSKLAVAPKDVKQDGLISFLKISSA